MEKKKAIDGDAYRSLLARDARTQEILMSVLVPLVFF